MSYNVNKFNPFKLGPPASGTPNTSKAGNFFSFGKTSTNNFGIRNISDGDGKSAIMKIISYLVFAFIAIMIILLFIHYFITPIFQTTPGGKGVIPVPGFDDGVLYWNKGDVTTIDDNTTPIKGIAYNYSMIMDIFIQNPLQFSNKPRILVNRGGIPTNANSAHTVQSLIEKYNFVVALAPDTNDLIVTITDSTNNAESLVLFNVPVQTPFRLGIIIMEQAFEVYINGHLMKTKTLSSQPLSALGSIIPPTGVNGEVAKVRNLKLWSRILTPPEIRYSKPQMMSAKGFDPSSFSSSTASCPAVDNTDSNNTLNIKATLSSSSLTSSFD